MALDLEARLHAGVMLLDGGMGSSLIARGLAAGSPPETWNLDRPDEVRSVHAACVAAGSRAVQTNTFGANPLALERYGLAAGMRSMNQAAALIAREAAGPDVLVAGNMGPTGKMLAPLGPATEELLEDCYARQAEVLAESGVDYIAVETMMDLSEALCALRAARRATGLPITVCMTFDCRRRGYFTVMGNRPADCARALAEEGAAALGANCSIPSAEMIELAAELLRAAPVPVVAKPNAGLPELRDGHAVYLQDPADFGRDMARVAAAGVRAVGGCCGTDGRFIAALRDALSTPSAADSSAEPGKAR